jgi:hypothetical protein
VLNQMSYKLAPYIEKQVRQAVQAANPALKERPIVCENVVKSIVKKHLAVKYLK